ncbi:MAG: hypothetical protein JNK58_12165 [Phycisphaerae bacterium]|nr:hypothetical protein [Phycisphaerae bacterium]
MPTARAGFGLSAEEEMRTDPFVRSTPVPMAVVGRGIPGYPQLVHVTPVEMVQLDSSFAQNVAAQVLNDMRYIASFDEIKQKYYYMMRDSLGNEAINMALAIIDRMASSPAVVNNFGYMLAQAQAPYPIICNSLRERLTTMLESGNVPPARVSRVLNTIGCLYASCGRFEDALTPFEQSLKGADEATYLESTAMIVVCAFHLADEARVRAYSNDLRSRLAQKPRLRGAVVSRVHQAYSLAEQGIHHPRVEMATDTHRPVVCPAHGNPKESGPSG